MGATQTEFDDGPAARGQHATRGLGRQQRLEVADVEHGAFDQLGFGQWGRNLEQRLVREDDRALRDGTDASGEAEVAQVLEGIRLEPAERFQVIERAPREAKGFQESERFLEARRDEKCPPGR